MAAMHGHLLECYQCHKQLDRQLFSRSQLKKKKTQARCKSCVSAAENLGSTSLSLSKLSDTKKENPTTWSAHLGSSSSACKNPKEMTEPAALDSVRMKQVASKAVHQPESEKNSKTDIEKNVTDPARPELKRKRSWQDSTGDSMDTGKQEQDQGSVSNARSIPAAKVICTQETNLEGKMHSRSPSKEISSEELQDQSSKPNQEQMEIENTQALNREENTASNSSQRIDSPTGVFEPDPAWDASMKKSNRDMRKKCEVILLNIYTKELKLTIETAVRKTLKMLKKFAGKEDLLFLKLQERNQESEKAVKQTSKDPNCDRCDGRHESSQCPVYKKPRGNHPDEQRGRYNGLASPGGNVFIPFHRAIVRRQPGDGSCLFHSMAFGLKSGRSAHALRKELAQWIAQNPNYKISNTEIREWVKWDSGKSVQSYAAQMMRGSWGGAIEMVACSKKYRCNVHVYESRRGRKAYQRISCFNYDGSRHTINVLYQGGIHYDALLLK